SSESLFEECGRVTRSAGETSRRHIEGTERDTPAARCRRPAESWSASRSEEHTSELQSRVDVVCRLLLANKKHMVDVGARHGGRLSALPAVRLVAASCTDADPRQPYTLSLHDALPIYLLKACSKSADG